MKNLIKLFCLCSIGMLLLPSCNDEAPIAELECPECSDYRAVCIEASCQCPEGYLELWYRARLFANTIPPTHYCLAPDSLTFLAHLPHNSCVDTFAVGFTAEPLGDTILGSGVSTLYAYIHRPGTRYTSRSERGFSGVFTNEAGELEFFYNFMDIATFPIDFLTDSECFAASRADEDAIPRGGSYVGIFVHEDTIRGQLDYLYQADSLAPAERIFIDVDLVRMQPY